MWSIGVEWLNYFLMPLLFIPVWRRFGNVALVIFAIVLCFLPYATKPLLHTEKYTLHWMQPWFIALFAVGMAGATLQFSRRGPGWLRDLDEMLRRGAIHPLTLALLAGAIYACWGKRVPMDFLVGAATVCLILHCCAGTPVGRAATGDPRIPFRHVARRDLLQPLPLPWPPSPIGAPPAGAACN